MRVGWLKKSYRRPYERRQAGNGEAGARMRIRSTSFRTHPVMHRDLGMRMLLLRYLAASIAMAWVSRFERGWPSMAI
jgi:hypothetical protein